MLGNPFSPFYARARARGVGRPLDHSCLHVALHGPRRSVWALCERPVSEASRAACELAIGRSRVAIDRGALRFDVEEPGSPFSDGVRGRVTVHFEADGASPIALDQARHHQWWPVAPLARVEVDLRSPGVRFEGDGYHDANAGRAPIEASFSGWTWSRAALRRSGEAAHVAIAYDVLERGGAHTVRSVLFDARTGAFDAIEEVSRAPLPATRWGLQRRAAADRGSVPHVERGLIDSPFYARSLVATRLLGRDATAIHEVLSADRLRHAWVRFLLGFRTRRAPHGGP